MSVQYDCLHKSQLSQIQHFVYRLDPCINRDKVNVLSTGYVENPKQDSRPRTFSELHSDLETGTASST